MSDLILALMGLVALTRRPPPQASRGKTRGSSPGKTSPPPAPKLRAMLYRTPADQYDTTRVAVEKAPGAAMEKRAIMSSPADAWKLVQESGWNAQPEVQQLEADPQ